MKILSQNELKLRYENLWKAVFIYSLPTIFVMTISASYPLIDKLISLAFVTQNVLDYQPYLEWYKNNINVNNGILSEQIAKEFVNIATQVSSQIYNLLFSFAVLTALGASISFSYRYGQVNREEAKIISGNSMTITVLFSLFAGLFVFTLVYPKWDNIIIFIQLSKKGAWIIQDLTWRYIWPMLIASPLMFINFLLLTLLGADGKGKWAALITVLSIPINAVFAIIFVKAGHLLLEGAILGTIVSWAISIAISMTIIYKNHDSYLRFRWHDLYILKKNNLKKIFQLGLPSFLNNLAIASVAILSATIIAYLPGQVEQRNQYGSSMLQLYNSAISPWIMLFTSVALGISQGSKSLISYSYGAKQYHKIYQISWRSYILVTGWLVIVFFICLLFAPSLMRVFAFPPENVSEVRWWVVLMMMSFPLAGISFTATTLFQGINKTRLATIVSSLRAIIILPILVIIGYFIAHAFDDGTTYSNWYYFLVIGLNDLISGVIVGIILAVFLSKRKNSFLKKPPAQTEPALI
ncbi:MATE family efflux transporter [Spiroplasma chrysopicola]|uniref:MATE efflux family protein n=1 Tax=Spiroplasma chrysopicola DF-1 TaxID=1276227 RepID=R4UAK6_9MOLU|nr:MATE family efflux transporter [Spiroplasma chrysopicola]AGM24944.1 MATE efflux family protein [Spiroplasma chrysopicola DF-1]